MTGSRYFLVSLAIGLSMVAGACETKERERSEKLKVESPGQQGQSESAYSGLTEFIRKQKLVNYPSTTIGNAFDSYSHVIKKEWKEESLKNGSSSVDFTGWFETATVKNKESKDGRSGKGIDVTFIVEPNGSFYVFMISTIEFGSDGKVHRTQSLDVSSILEKIYSNKKIDFS